ncbi:MAG TPA: cyclopropane-fatty-acyl-phospholipid synthase family protein [Casimicrobiaceae bacterium]|nr:cyclopropane-fatty-acyl-phospholipid synthase family protein [Casimicrobiaceae bacterium]
MNGVERSLKKKISEVGIETQVCLRLVYADGSSYQNREGPPQTTILFRSPGAEYKAMLFGHIGLLEAYFEGEVDVEGDLALACRAGLDAGLDSLPNPLIAASNQLHELRFSNRSLVQAKENARSHYGLGADFYRFWLDQPAMMYTCGYWNEGTQSLEDAQRNKMDHVCRKVLLQSGDSFVDIGCGWGGLLFHALDHYGALGTGINTCTEQVAELREDIARRKLQEKVAVLECDFREIPQKYDKLLSIGTLEHAGRDQLPEVVRAHADCLKPGGLGVIHFIGHVGVRDTEFYIRKHIFPGGWIPSLAQALAEMERCGLEVLDVENLRRHYALTLDAWADRFDSHWQEIHALDPVRFDEYFRRKWRIYLYSCAEMFRSPKGQTHLFQVTVSKGNVGGGYPMGRDHLYRPGHA